MGKNTLEVSGFALAAWQNGCRWEAEPQTYPGCLLVEAGVQNWCEILVCKLDVQNLECKTQRTEPGVQNSAHKTGVRNSACLIWHAKPSVQT